MGLKQLLYIFNKTKKFQGNYHCWFTIIEARVIKSSNTSQTNQATRQAIQIQHTFKINWHNHVHRWKRQTHNLIGQCVP